MFEAVLLVSSRDILFMWRIYLLLFLEMNAMEVLPPSFDASLKYPVLFHVYGGPSSQLVSYQYDLSWHTFVASYLGYIVVTVRLSVLYKRNCSNNILTLG